MHFYLSLHILWYTGWVLKDTGKICLNTRAKMISDSLDHCKTECRNRNASRLTYDDYGIGAIEGATLGGYCRCCESRSGPLEPTSYEYPTYVYTFLGKSYIFHILRNYPTIMLQHVMKVNYKILIR